MRRFSISTLLLATAVIAILIAYWVHTSPSMVFQRTNNALAFSKVMSKLPIGTDRRRIEARLGNPGTQISRTLLELHIGRPLTDQEYDRDFATYCVLGEYGNEYLMVLRYENEKLAHVYDVHARGLDPTRFFFEY